LPQLVQEGSNFSPRFLPDGQQFLYYLRGSREARGVYVGRLDGLSPTRRLLDADSPGAVYAPSGHLLFVRDRTLFAQGFDATTLALTGNPFTVAQYATGCACLGLTVSDNGSIAYRSTATPPRRQFVWFDRSGNEIAKLGDATFMASPSLSPDGSRVLGYRGNPVDGNIDVWTLDTRRGVFTRLTDDPSDDVVPAWSPDGGRIAFSSNRKGTHNIYVKSADGSSSDELIFESPGEKSVTHWTSDGRFVLFDSHDSKRGTDIFAVPLSNRKPIPIAQTQFDEHRAQASPNGKWVAFQSDESGRDEIYVQPFPGPGSKWPISTHGGTQVRWRPDGKELFYVGLDGRLMDVPIRFVPNAQTPEVGTAVPLFSPPLGGAIQQADFRHQYMVSSDGQRFLVATVGDATIAPITVILNWKPASMTTRLSSP
jgi:Tol biopolymer transport system component